MIDLFAYLQSILLGPERAAPTVYSDRIMMLGHILWVLAYVLILARGHRDQVLGISAVAICLNIVWEVLIYFNCYALKGEKGICAPYVSGEWGLVLALILCLDALLLLQAIVLLSRRFGLVWTILMLSAGIALSLGWHISFIITTHDALALVDSWIINLVMSVLFVALALRRPKGEGLSFGAAIAKLLGSLAVIVAILLHPFKEDAYLFVGERATIVTALAALVLIADVLFAVLLTLRQSPKDLTA